MEALKSSLLFSSYNSKAVFTLTFLSASSISVCQDLTSSVYQSRLKIQLLQIRIYSLLWVVLVLSHVGTAQILSRGSFISRENSILY